MRINENRFPLLRDLPMETMAGFRLFRCLERLPILANPGGDIGRRYRLQ